MSKNVLIRNLDDDVIALVEEIKPRGIAQNEFLKSLIGYSLQDYRQPSLFREEVRTINNPVRLPFTFIDLFAGIGGFRSALTKLGGRCLFTNEIDKYAAATYSAWYNDTNISNQDIYQVDIDEEIPSHDILCAGFPCQPFSIAGVSKKNSLGREHGFNDEKQGNLFFRILDIVDKKRPPILFLENVKNLKSHDKGNTWRVIQRSLEEREYSVFAKIIDARYWVPQHRERMFIVGFDRIVFGSVKDFAFPDTVSLAEKTLDSILESDEIDKKYMLTDKLWGYLQNYAEKHRAKGNGFGFGLFNGSGVARTLSARYYKDGSEVLIDEKGWKNPRRLTPREARDLMGFTCDYAELFGHKNGFPQVVSDTQAYKQFGNSVVPKVVEAIAVGILQQIYNHFYDKSLPLLKKSV